MDVSRSQTSFPVGGSTKEIVESTVTGSRPAEEILEQLDSYGIEWYLTEKGDLLVKYWQVAAEDLVPVERVGEIREGRDVPDDAAALEWLSAHLEELTRQYAGRWIAISNSQVVASSTDLANLLHDLKVYGVERPFVTEVPEETVVWKTAYADAIV